MRVRIIGPQGVAMPGMEAPIEQKVRLAIGSWSTVLRQVTVKLNQRADREGGLDMECSIEASPLPPGESPVHAIGTDLDAVVRSAVRQLMRRVKEGTRR
jgi:hypothetical protein